MDLINDGGLYVVRTIRNYKVRCWCSDIHFMGVRDDVHCVFDVGDSMAYKYITAMLVDPFKRTIKPVALDLNTSLLEQMYELMDCMFVARRPIDNGEIADILWVDDNGLMKDDTRYFSFVYPNGKKVPGETFAGKALIIGQTDEYENADCRRKLEEYKKMIVFDGKLSDELKPKAGFTVVNLDSPNVHGALKRAHKLYHNGDV